MRVQKDLAEILDFGGPTSFKLPILTIKSILLVLVKVSGLSSGPSGDSIGGYTCVPSNGHVGGWVM